jgi:hypothetical protein
MKQLQSRPLFFHPNVYNTLLFYNSFGRMHKKHDIANMTKFQVSNMFKLNEFQDQAFKNLHKIHTNKATIKI